MIPATITTAAEFHRRRFGATVDDTAGDIIDLIQRNHPDMAIGTACEALGQAMASLMGHYAGAVDADQRAYRLIQHAVGKFMQGGDV